LGLLYSIDFLGGFIDNVLEDLGSVHFFESVGLLEDVNSSFSDVSLEVLVFVGQELFELLLDWNIFYGVDTLSLNIQELLVKSPELQLVFGN
jgi:hypothetical protein